MLTNYDGTIAERWCDDDDNADKEDCNRTLLPSPPSATSGELAPRTSVIFFH